MVIPSVGRVQTFDTWTHSRIVDTEMFLQSWPPQDPVESEFRLPDSPWTYSNGDLNPNLQPGQPRRRKKRVKTHAEVPPYHPDYVKESDTESYEDDVASSGDEYEEGEPPRRKVRRGSEGFEIRPVGREDMLQRYMQEQGDVVTSEVDRKYNRYVPEPHSSESEAETDEDDRPLGLRTR